MSRAREILANLNPTYEEMIEEELRKLNESNTIFEPGELDLDNLPVVNLHGYEFLDEAVMLNPRNKENIAAPKIYQGSTKAAGVIEAKLVPSVAAHLSNWCALNRFPDPEPTVKLHATLYLSPSKIEYKDFRYNPPIDAPKVRLAKGDDGRTLMVQILDNPALNDRVRYLASRFGPSAGNINLHIAVCRDITHWRPKEKFPFSTKISFAFERFF